MQTLQTGIFRLILCGRRARAQGKFTVALLGSPCQRFRHRRFSAGVLSRAGFEPTLDVYPTNEGHITMGKILSKISGPLLIGSILALGALAFPVHADAADGRLIVFRAQSGLIDRPTLVADNGSEGTDAETSPGTGGEGTGDGSGDGSEPVEKVEWPSDAIGATHTKAQVTFALYEWRPIDRTGDGRIGPGDALAWTYYARNDGGGSVTGLRFELPSPPFLALSHPWAVDCDGSISAGEVLSCSGEIVLGKDSRICQNPSKNGQTFVASGATYLNFGTRDGLAFDLSGIPDYPMSPTFSYVVSRNGC
ncbi:MAG: hypothetical protein WBA42_18035 [Mesorhizobium sp.]